MNKFITLLAFLISLSLSSQTINPKVERQDINKCNIKRIDIQASSTVVYMEYNNGSSAWVCVNKGYFIEDLSTGKRYKLLSTDNIPKCPEKKIFNEENKTIEFTLVFERIPDTDKINIIEDENNPSFNFYGVELIHNVKSEYEDRKSEIYASSYKILIYIGIGIFISWFLRKRFKWYIVFLIFTLVNFFVSLTLEFIFLRMKSEYVSINFDGYTLLMQFAENIGYSLVIFWVVFPFFFRKKKLEVNASDPNKSEEDLRQEFEGKLKELKEKQNEEILSDQVKLNKRPIAFYLSILFGLLFVLALIFIFSLSSEVYNCKGQNENLVNKNVYLNQQIERRNSEISLDGFLTNENRALNCTTETEIIVNNGLTIPIRLYISMPHFLENGYILWEKFDDTYYSLNIDYIGHLSKDKVGLVKSNLIKYYVTDENGNAFIGSKQHPIYYSPCDNESKGIILN